MYRNEANILQAQCAFCRQAELLPLKCQGCSLLFCQSHSQPVSHQCSAHPAQQDRQRSKSQGRTCQKCKGKVTLLNEFTCKVCSSLLCLKHRHQENHVCLPNKTAKQALPLPSGQKQKRRGGWWVCCGKK